MTEGDIQAGAWFRDVINVLEPFFLFCHPQWMAFFVFWFFSNQEFKMATHYQASATDRRKKETSGERSGTYTRKANIFCKSTADFTSSVRAVPCGHC